MRLLPSSPFLALALWLGAVTGIWAAEPATQPCRLPGVRVEVRCGSVQRALDPARPDGPRIEVHFAVVPALSRQPLPDPVFFLAGGPGQSAIALAPTVLAMLERLRARRDVVLVDQRREPVAPMQAMADHQLYQVVESQHVLQLVVVPEGMAIVQVLLVDLVAVVVHRELAVRELHCKETMEAVAQRATQVIRLVAVVVVRVALVQHQAL